MALHEDCRELVPSETGDKIGGAQGRPDFVGDPFQDPVAARVAMGVIDIFEIIHIDDQQ